MEGLYLIHAREFITIKKPIYKIGRGGNLYQRIKQYPNGSNLLFSHICKNSVFCETQLIGIFKDKFVQEKFYGREYFSGDFHQMIKIMYNYIDTYNIKCIEEANAKIIIKKKVKEEVKVEIKKKDKTEVKEKVKNKIYICPKCKDDFKYKSLLIRHLKNSVRCLSTNIYINDTIDKIDNTNINNNLFMCNDCNKYFKFKTSIYRHKTISKCAKNKIKNIINN